MSRTVWPQPEKKEDEDEYELSHRIKPFSLYKHRLWKEETAWEMCWDLFQKFAVFNFCSVIAICHTYNMLHLSFECLINHTIGKLYSVCKFVLLFPVKACCWCSAGVQDWWNLIQDICLADKEALKTLHNQFRLVSLPCFERRKLDRVCDQRIQTLLEQNVYKLFATQC